MEDLQSKLAQWQQLPMEADTGKGRKGGSKGKGRKGADDDFIEYEQEEGPSPARREDEQVGDGAFNILGAANMLGRQTVTRYSVVMISRHAVGVLVTWPRRQQ